MVKYLESFRNQIIAASSAIVILPLVTFFTTKSYLTGQWVTKDLYDPQNFKALRAALGSVDNWSAISAIVCVQLVIFAVIIIKHTEDILDVFVYGKGGVPYDPNQKAPLDPSQLSKKKLRQLEFEKRKEEKLKEMKKEQENAEQEAAQETVNSKKDKNQGTTIKGEKENSKNSVVQRRQKGENQKEEKVAIEEKGNESTDEETYDNNAAQKKQKNKKKKNKKKRY